MIPNSIRDFKSVETYLLRIGAEPKGLFTAVVKETVGEYWRELANVRFHKNGDVVCTLGYEPTEQESSLIKAEFASAQWPKCVFPTSLENLPTHLKNADAEHLFVFWDVDHKHILMLQHRIETKKGKAYIPYSFWDDDQWRACEPETESGLLPLYGLHTLKDQTVCFASEGAKTSRFVESIINPKTPEEKERADNFPWKEQFKYAASVGFVGGAMIPERTDWAALKKAGIQRVIILCDADQPGIEVVPKISNLVDLPCFAIKMSDEYPRGWDMADPWPSDMYRSINGKKYYVGPSYFDCLSPATTMTYERKYIDDKGKEKKKISLRHYAKNQWSYIEGQDLFINTEFPQFQWTPELLDKYLVPFSHAKKTSDLLIQEYSCRIGKIAYRPGVNKRRVMSDGEMALNLYRPSNIMPQDGDPKPFLDFVYYLIPDEKEAYSVLKWIATIVARPEIHMIYGLLLISENTGVGKTLLAESIIAPLVGLHNSSFPSETTILEPYTGWIAKKKYVSLSEIYQGHSFKMANRLKSYITDNKISYREMYMPTVTIDNYAQFVACSNSMLALRLSEEDRRWEIPKITETRLPDEKYDALFEWLASGGLSIIRKWADDFGDYVKKGDKAPMTAQKKEIIESSRSKASVRVQELAGIINQEVAPTAVPDKEIMAFLEAITKERVYETLLEVRKIMKKHGAIEAKDFGVDRISYNSQMCNILLNKSAATELEKIVDVSQRKDYVRSIVRKPNELMVYEN